MALRAGTMRTGFAASLMLHLFALAALFALIRARPLSPPVETSVDVELLQPSEIPVPSPAAASPTEPERPASPPENPALPLVEPTPLPQIPGKPSPPEIAPAEPQVPPPIHAGRIPATEMLSGKVLADPRSREALRQLRQLAAPDRIEQLCNLEAMQQIHRWKADFAPEFVVAYAARDPIYSPRSIEARGAAFLSHAHWYAIDFLCTVTDDLQAVASFEFLVGREIPQDRWEEYSLFASSKVQD